MPSPHGSNSSSLGHPNLYPRRFRLKSPRIIRAILKDRDSGRHGSEGFRMAWRQAEDADSESKFAFVVSRDAGGAAIRNRIKRRLREAVRLQKSVWPSVPAKIVFRVNHPQISDMSWPRLKANVEAALKKIGNDSHQ